jgi:hypothetical protein
MVRNYVALCWVLECDERLDIPYDIVGALVTRFAVDVACSKKYLGRIFLCG